MEMKSLKKIIQGVKLITIHGEADRELSKLTFDSRTVEEGDCFFAIVGELNDGHDHISSAVERGAKVVVCQRLPEQCDPEVSYIEVDDTNDAMARMAATYYGNPSCELSLVGITGTNGKTTTVTLLYDLFRTLGYKVGMISTIMYKIDNRNIESTHTTPDSIRLNMMLREMVDQGCEQCFIEVSSHALVQKRVQYLHFAGALFSNITHDHLDYHKTFAEYIKAKQELFNNLTKEAFVVTNIDDRNGTIMVQNSCAKVYTLSLQSPADFRCKIIESHFDGMLLRIDGVELWVNFSGRFNAYNLLSVYATAILLGVDRDELLQAMSRLSSVDGRFESTRSTTGITAIIDYAHTPDALKNVIEAIKEIKLSTQRILVVCGCGGDRDKAKRPEMARIAVEQADVAIFTSDNPRGESAETILDQMVAGLNYDAQFLRITSRAEAIKSAVMFAKSGDIILIAGKGHETYQIVGDKKEHFDDREVVKECFKLMKK